jgi:fluoroacetyl-CoA thioesterase
MTDPPPVPPGSRSRLTHEVGPQDTASALGSGDLPVLATPRLLAWLEGATCVAAAAELGQEETSVGARVSVEHLAPTPVGGRLEVGAVLDHRDGRHLRFAVDAVDDAGRTIATGRIERVIVHRGRFLARLDRS